MAQLTKQALIVENNQSFPNNNAGAITPSILRNFNTDIIDSTVNQSVYTADSGSWNEKIDGLSTGSALITASVDFSTITFTKGDGTQFDLVVTASVATVDWNDITDKPSGLVSGSSQVVDILTSVNSFTASQETKDSTLATYTGSVDTKFATIGSQSGSWENVPLTSLNAFTQSQETKNTTLGTYTGSVDTKFNTLGSQSGSWVNESETGSFARVDVSNTFTADQTINGTLNVTTLNATTIHTIIESSSVIYSSGSNQFGDELTDTQTLSGSVKVVGSLTVNGVDVITSSVDISALNSFTASQESKDSTLGTYTGSVDTKFNTIGTQSGSWENVPLTSLNSFTASQEILNAKFATTGSNIFDGGQTITGSILQTGGNSNFTANVNIDSYLSVGLDAIITGSLKVNGAIDLTPTSVSTNSGYPIPFISGSRISKDSVDTLMYNPSINSLYVSGSTGRTGVGITGLNVSSGSGAYGTQSTLISRTTLSNSIEGNNYIAISANPSKTGQASLASSTNPAILAISSSGEIYSAIELQTSSSFTDGRVTIKKPLVVEGNLTASLQEGYAWVGGASNITNAVPTSSFGGGGTTDISSLNAFTASQEILNDTFATTGSNTFIGNQIVRATTGVPLVIDHSDASPTQNTLLGILKSGSAVWDLGNSGTSDSFVVYNPDTFQTPLSIRQDNGVELLGSLTASLQEGYALVGGPGNVTNAVPTSSFGGGGTIVGYATTGSNIFNGTQTITGSILQSGGNSTFAADVTMESNLNVGLNITADKLVLTGGSGLDLIVTGSGRISTALNVGVLGGESAYLNQYGFSALNDATGDDFGLTGNGTDYGVSGWAGPSIYGNDPSDLYPALIGFQNKADWTDGTITVLKPLDIIGSLTVSGSINNSVHTLSITSNTASIDASVGTTFVLSLVDATNTRLEVSNTTYGQTLNLLVSQSAAGTGTLTFGGNFYEPSGSFYSASAVASAKDIITLATFVEPNVVYVASIKNLIV